MQEKELKRLIGQRIRTARKRQGLSQREFADLIGKDQRSVSMYETGERSILIHDIFLYAQVLNVTPEYFIQFDQSLDANQQRLLNEFNRLPTDQSKQSALDILRAFSKAISE